ncbi:MAG: hypothetical protein IPN17_12395 [Deltaproteobacteria bacterium]|nr:hypothetical protein [Deltaproteobacteria bacterium]
MQSATLSLLTIRAPFDGTIVIRPPRPGELLGSEPMAGIGHRAADFRSMVAEVDVPEGLNLVRPAGPARSPRRLPVALPRRGAGDRPGRPRQATVAVRVASSSRWTASSPTWPRAWASSRRSSPPSSSAARRTLVPAAPSPPRRARGAGGRQQRRASAR